MATSIGWQNNPHESILDEASPIIPAVRARLSQRASVALACGLFLLIAGQFFWVTPILEGPDSYQHFKYVRYLVIHHQFPTLSDDPREAPFQEAAQYPLYYLLGAAMTFPISTADFDQTVAINPHAGDPRGNGNGNFLFHRPFSGFPHGTELAARLVGILSLACGAATVACAVLLARLAEPKSRWLPVAAGLALASVPPFAAFSSYVTNDDLVTGLSAVTIVLLAYWAIKRTSKWSWFSAVVLALAVLAKFNAIGLVVPYAVAALLAGRRWRELLASLARLVAAILVVDGWWMVRNQLLYGDFTGMLAINGHAAGKNIDLFATPLLVGVETTLRQLPGIMHGLFSTGAYGIDSPPSLYLVTTVLGAVGLAAGLVGLLRRVRKWPWMILVLLWPAVNLAEVTLYGANIATLGARYYFPAIACLAVMVAIGWSDLLSALRLSKLGWPLSLSGVGVALLVPRLVVAPVFAYPSTIASLPGSARAIEATFDDSVQLIGAESSTPSYIQPGVNYDLTLYWRLKQPTERKLDTFVHIDSLDPSYSSGASYDGAVGGGNFPPSFWPVGKIIVDRYHFAVRPDTRDDRRNAVPLAVHVGMYDEDRGKIPAHPDEAADTGVQVALWKLPGAELAGASQAPLATFDNGLELLSARANTSNPRSVKVDLRWQANTQPAGDFTVFVQLLSPDGQVLAQHDSYPLNRRYPTGLWTAGEQVVDDVELPLREPMPKGGQLVAGLYLLPDVRPIPTSTGGAYATIPLN